MKTATNDARPHLLVVDDEVIARRLVEAALDARGYRYTTTESAEEALRVFVPRRFDLVLTDLRLPGKSGLDLLDAIRSQDPETPVVVMTAFASITLAVDAVRRGAADFVAKTATSGLELGHLEVVLERALHLRSVAEEVHRLRPLADPRERLGAMLGSSLAMKRVYTLIDRVAPRDLTVLVQGESGTGKELAARAIHDHSPRRAQRFQVVNCAALQETLLTSELFGHEKGAFTGADMRKTGHFEVARGGTLFLDEVGESPPGVQALLLRALQEKEIVRVGGTDPIPVDVRIVAATNRPLAEQVKSGAFREDLFYRLSAFPIEMPALRDRGQDIAQLAEHFVGAVRESALPLGDDVVDALSRHAWPGNVRELKNVLERAEVLADGRPIGIEDLTPEIAALGGGADDARPTDSARADGAGGLMELPLRDARAAFERLYFERLLGACDGNVSETARRSGLGRTFLHEKLQKLDLNPGDFRPARP